LLKEPIQAAQQPLAKLKQNLKKNGAFLLEFEGINTPFQPMKSVAPRSEPISPRLPLISPGFQ
jgi:hypothetical protein